jgi:hypothetical protein
MAGQIDSPAHHLPDVFWIGGSPCAGKSSIADMLAREYNLQLYHCDEHYEAHLRRADPVRHPVMSAATGKSWDEVWMHPVDFLVAREIAFYREEFDLILKDLLAMPRSAPLCAEGAALLPECVAPLLDRPNRGVWIVPTEEFQRKEYARRDWVANILRQCIDPQLAWENWMGRDAQFARVVAQQAVSLGFEVLEVDGSGTIAENARRVAEQFGLRPSTE